MSNDKLGSSLHERIQDLVEQAESGDLPKLKAWREQARMLLRAVFGEGDAVLERFDRIKYSSGVGSAYDSDADRAARARTARQRGIASAVAILRSALTHLEIQTDNPVPTVDVAGLHPWFAGAAATLWNDGHHRQAVEEACRSVEIQLKVKLGLDMTGVPLATAGLNPKEPTADQPRLRFSEFDPGTDGWTNAHQGAMHFGQGCFMRIRNLYTHQQEPSESEALEALAAISLFARWVDTATVEYAP